MGVAPPLTVPKAWMKPQRVPTPLLQQPARSEIIREPKGVVLTLTPWNFPVRRESELGGVSHVYMGAGASSWSILPSMEELLALAQGSALFRKLRPRSLLRTGVAPTSSSRRRHKVSPTPSSQGPRVDFAPQTCHF